MADPNRQPPPVKNSLLTAADADYSFDDAALLVPVLAVTSEESLLSDTTLSDTGRLTGNRRGVWLARLTFKLVFHYQFCLFDHRSGFNSRLE